MSLIQKALRRVRIMFLHVLSILPVFTLRTVISTDDSTQGPSYTHSDALMLFSIEFQYHNPQEWEGFISTTESWGYQKQAEVWEIKDPIVLHGSRLDANPKLQGEDIKIIFHFKHIRNPDSFRKFTGFTFIAPYKDRLREWPCRMRSVPPFDVNSSRVAHTLCHGIRINRSDVFWMLNRGRLTLKIEIGFGGNADQEVTPMGPLIDEEMAEIAYQKYSIRVPIIVEW